MRPLRTWQRRALAEWSRLNEGVAAVVTGAGKTTFAMACIESHLARAPTTHVLVVVPTVALMDQWAVEFTVSFGSELGQTIVHGGGASGSLESRLHVAVVNTARTLTQRLPSGVPWMVVADECHRYGAPANRTAIRGDWSASLGLSATPVRQYDDWFDMYVVPVIGPVFFEYSYEDALQDGILSPFAISNYRVPLTQKEWSGVQEVNRQIAILLSRGLSDDDIQVKRARIRRARLLQSARSRIPSAVQIMQGRVGRRALVFHEQIAAADQLVHGLAATGHRVSAYHSRLSPAARQKNLLMFRTGQVDVLVTCRALDEGLDVPDADFGLIVASSSSTRQRIQRMGRLLRKSEGKAEAEVATLYAYDSERDRLEQEEARLAGVADVRWYRVDFS